jgi:hypothetical protein
MIGDLGPVRAGDVAEPTAKSLLEERSKIRIG